MGLETTAALRAVFLGSSLRRLHGQPQLQAVRPAVYLFITPLEVNVLNCRFVVPRQARIP